MPALINPKWERFAQNIAAGDTTAKAAYIKAGFKAKSASSGASALLRNEDVEARINELTEKIAQARANEIWHTKQYVLDGLKENYRRAMQLEEIRHKGEVVGLQYNGAVANRALELLGKELGMFVDRVDMDAKLSVKDLSQEALDILLAEAAQLVAEKDSESVN